MRDTLILDNTLIGIMAQLILDHSDYIIIGLAGLGVSAVHNLMEPSAATILHGPAQDLLYHMLDNSYQDSIIRNSLDLQVLPVRHMVNTPGVIDAIQNQRTRIAEFIIVHNVTQELSISTMEPQLFMHARFFNSVFAARDLMGETTESLNGAMTQISNMGRPVSVRMHISIEMCENFTNTATPYVPRLDILATRSWALDARVEEMADYHLSITNTSRSIRRLRRMINGLVSEHDDLVEAMNQTDDDDIAEQAMLHWKVATQFLRYLETIYKWFDPSYVSSIPVEDFEME